MVEMQQRYDAASKVQPTPSLTITKLETPPVITPQRAFHNHLFTDGEFKNYRFNKAFTVGEADKEIRIMQRKLARL